MPEERERALGELLRGLRGEHTLGEMAARASNPFYQLESRQIQSWEHGELSAPGDFLRYLQALAVPVAGLIDVLEAIRPLDRPSRLEIETLRRALGELSAIDSESLRVVLLSRIRTAFALCEQSRRARTAERQITRLCSADLEQRSLMMSILRGRASLSASAGSRSLGRGGRRSAG